jgi:peptide/nickel transport system substrate-binding protein
MRDETFALMVALGPVLLGCSGPKSSVASGARTAAVVAAIGEPASVLPPLVTETVGRDIGDLVYERLADLLPGRSPIDSSAYRPRLAARWERLDSVSWRFHLAGNARWADGRPVTSEDVRFSFEAFSDSLIDAPARPYLAGHVRILPEDSTTFRVVFARRSPEQLYDATYHVRVIPAHLWSKIPRQAWASDTVLGHLVGSGPFRVAEWKRGRFLRLESRRAEKGAFGQVVWRFAPDPDAALNLLLGHEADLMELVGPTARDPRPAADSSLRLVTYPSAAYGFLGFKMAAADGKQHPILGSQATRRGLAMAVDRRALARSVFGPDAVAPPGPMSRLLWIWSDSIRTLPFDTARAARELEQGGWHLDRDGWRRRQGSVLRFDVLVPSSSSTRRELAAALQAMWRVVGARVTVTTVDFPVFQERLREGKFDCYIGAWLDEPSPRGLADQWTRAGWQGLNYGHYANPRFDLLFHQAAATAEPEAARRLYRRAMDVLNADAPAIFLYSPTNKAAVSTRLNGVEIDPYSWLSGLPAWRVR